MKKVLLFFFVLIGLAVSCSYRNVPIIWYWENEIIESLGIVEDYCVYDYSSSFKSVMDMEECIPAHYQILLPSHKVLKRILYGSLERRCFLYTRGRGIAIIQDLHDWERKYENGLNQISPEMVEDQLSIFEEVSGKKIRVTKNRQHFMFVDNEIRIIMFNLSEDDYHSFVEFPIENLKIRRRGEVRTQEKYRNAIDN